MTGLGRLAANVKKTAAVFLFAAACGAAAAEPDPSGSFTSKEGVTFRLPPGWVQIPKDALDRHFDAVFKDPSQSPKCDFGFQPGGSERWFEYPYVIVLIIQSGRVPEYAMTSTDAWEKEFKKGLQGSVDASEFVDAINVFGWPHYDEDAHIAFSLFALDAAQVGKVFGLSALLLTEEGVIQILGYAKPQDFDKYAPVFEEIARNVELPDELQYEPRLSDMEPLERIAFAVGMLIGVGFVACVIAGCVILILWLRRRKN